MDRRKKLVNEYKQRKLIGGIYKITNSLSEMYLLDRALDIKAIQNRFNFSVSTGSCFHHKMQKDWKEFGGKIFTFEILESIEIKEGQSQDEFMDDLKMLEEIWRDKLDISNAY
ncbi:GIY-YIG nuclease family protein [Chloroflexota bacterium]